MRSRSAGFFALAIALLLTLSSGLANAATAPSPSVNSTTAAVSPVSSPTLITEPLPKFLRRFPRSFRTRWIQVPCPPPLQSRCMWYCLREILSGLTNYLEQIANPLSSQYRHFLTPQEYALLYGPDTSEVSALSSYFGSKGLSSQIDASNPEHSPSKGEMLQDVDAALRVSLQEFQSLQRVLFLRHHHAAAPRPVLERAGDLWTIKLWFSSGWNFKALPMARVFGKLSGLPGQTNANFIYYAPSELYHIYNTSSLLSAGYSGSGVTIAIVDAYGDPYIQQELDNFSSQFHLPASKYYADLRGWAVQLPAWESPRAGIPRSP